MTLELWLTFVAASTALAAKEKGGARRRPSPAGSAPKAGRPATRRQGSPRAGQQTTGRMSAAKSLFCLFRPSTAKASGRPAACPETPK